MIRILCVVLFAAAAIAGETVKEPELSPVAERKFRAKLRNIRFPKIDFRDSTAREAIEFLVTKTKSTEADIGMNFRLAVAEKSAAQLATDIQPAVVKIPNLSDASKVPPDPIVPETTRRITFRAKNVSVEEILDEICRQAKLRWKLTPHGLLMTPLPSPTRHRR